MSLSCIRRQADQQVEGACESVLRQGEVFTPYPFRMLDSPSEAGPHASSSMPNLLTTFENLWKNPGHGRLPASWGTLGRRTL